MLSILLIHFTRTPRTGEAPFVEGAPASSGARNPTEAQMQEGQESGCEFLDPRSLAWEQRYALRRRAVEWAQDERARSICGLLARVRSRATRAAPPGGATAWTKRPPLGEIGRASCRERV